MQVDCPLCHQPITIPPDKIESTPGQGMPGLNPKLKTAISTSEHKPTTFAPSPLERPVKKKSKFTPQAIGWTIAGVALVVAGVLLGPKYYHQYEEKKAEKEAAEAAANNPPPPPPEPSASEIMRKVGATYKAMKGYSANGKTTATLDMSELVPGNPAMKSISLTADTSLALARPDLYRLEWSLQAGQSALKGATWCAGKGNYVALGPYPTKVKSREAALSQASGTSGTLGMMLIEMFFEDKDNPASSSNDFAKTNSESLNGQDCYVLAGEENAMKLQLWINKKNLLVAQAKLVLEGKLDDAAYKAETNATVKAQLLRASKIRGAISETYQNIEVDKPLPAADFEKPLPAHS
jgi:hypothetical protein